MNRNCGKTHHAECWRQHGHSACAEREMARLQERYDLAVKKNGEQFYKIEQLCSALRPFADAHRKVNTPNRIVNSAELITLHDLRMAAEALDKEGT